MGKKSYRLKTEWTLGHSGLLIMAIFVPINATFMDTNSTLNYTAIFLTNRLCIVYCSLLQFLTLVYPGWGKKSEFFCLLVTSRRLRSGTVVGTIVLQQPTVSTRQPRAIQQGKGQSKVPCQCLPGGHIQGHWGVFTVVPDSDGLRVVPHLPCTCQPVSFRST